MITINLLGKIGASVIVGIGMILLYFTTNISFNENTLIIEIYRPYTLLCTIILWFIISILLWNLSNLLSFEM